MSHRRAKKARRQTRCERLAKGQNPDVQVAPQHNFTDLPDTRQERRTKQFRKRRHAADLKAASILEHRMWVQKWNKAFERLLSAKEEKTQ